MGLFQECKIIRSVADSQDVKKWLILSMWVIKKKKFFLLLLLSRFSRVRLCDPIDGSPPGSAVPGILQARTLEWGAISFSNAWKWKVKVKLLSCVPLFTTPWTAAYQAPPSMGFSRQEYWSGVPLPSPKFLSTGKQNNTAELKRKRARKQSLWPSQEVTEVHPSLAPQNIVSKGHKVSSHFRPFPALSSLLMSHSDRKLALTPARWPLPTPPALSSEELGEWRF